MLYLLRVLAIVSALATTAWSQDYGPLGYDRRGNHWEGLRGTPISGSIQLLSARVVNDTRPVDGQGGTPSRWADMTFGRFWLPCDEPVTFTVRQIRAPSTIYVLDRVQFRWTAGTVNEYRWSTAPVLAKLTGVSPDDLGIVVNLGEGKDTTESVAPAILDEEVTRQTQPRYRFTFRTNAAAEVAISILDSGQRVVFERPRRTEEARNPFTVVWPAPAADSGWYRLHLDAQFEDGAFRVKEVVFHHSVDLWTPNRTVNGRPGQTAPSCSGRSAVLNRAPV